MESCDELVAGVEEPLDLGLGGCRIGGQRGKPAPAAPSRRLAGGDLRLEVQVSGVVLLKE